MAEGTKDELSNLFPEADGWEKDSGESYDAWEWDTDDHKILTGLLVEKRENVGPNNSKMYIIERAGTNGQRVAVWGNTLIDKRMSNKNIGQELGIVYKGKTKNPETGRQYHDYDFYFKKGGASDLPFDNN